MFELINSHIPFYAYEPISMGMTQNLIKDSIVPKDMIAMSPKELAVTLSKKIYARFNIDDIYKGNNIEKINFNNYQ